MANEFLNTPLIPGAPVEPHIHRRLMVVFIVVVVLILIVLGLYYFIPAKTEAPSTTAPVVDQMTLMRQAIVSQLSSASPPTAAQLSQVSSQLKKSKTSVTNDQRAAIVQQLQASQ